MKRRGSAQVVVIVLLALLLAGVALYALQQNSKLRDNNLQVTEELAATQGAEAPPESRDPHAEALPKVEPDAPHTSLTSSDHVLSDRSLEAFADNLKTVEPLAVELEYIPKATALAGQIETGFKQGGWPVQRVVCVCYPPPKKLSLSFKTRPSEKLLEMFSPLFDDLGYERATSINPRLPKDAVLVHVGL